MEAPAEVLAVLAPLAVDLARALKGELATVVPDGLPAPAPAIPQGDPDYNRLWQALGTDPTDMDELVVRSGLTAARLSAMLLALELEGRVAAEHGRYCRIGG